MAPEEQVLRKELMENITLLWTLNEIVELPKENVLRNADQEWRQLSIDEEKTVADFLSFLSATTDNAHKVMAICLEESRDHTHLTIRMASNSGDFEVARQGFEDMTRILERASRRAYTEEQDYGDFLECVVRVDWLRILSRLRSRHAVKSRKVKSKTPPLVQLHSCVYNMSHSAESNPAMRDMRDRALALNAHFIEFETKADRDSPQKTATEMLVRLIEDLAGFVRSSRESLVDALESLRTLDPTTKEYIPIAIEKLARYSVASRFLVRTARKTKNSIFNNILVEPVKITEPVERLLPESSLTSDEVYRNICHDRQQQARPTLKSYYGTNYSRMTDNFRSRVSGTSGKGKVHAEIQLLFYYAANPQKTKARIIASSKSACYLCNMFVNLHRQFQLPRTHGRIYDRWGLPYWTVLPDLERDLVSSAAKDLNAAIQDRIVGTLKNPKISHLHPNESILFNYNSPASSIAASVHPLSPRATPSISNSGHSVRDTQHRGPRWAANLVRPSSRHSSVPARSPGTAQYEETRISAASEEDAAMVTPDANYVDCFDRGLTTPRCHPASVISIAPSSDCYDAVQWTHDIKAREEKEEEHAATNTSQIFSMSNVSLPLPKGSRSTCTRSAFPADSLGPGISPSPRGLDAGEECSSSTLRASADIANGSVASSSTVTVDRKVLSKAAGCSPICRQSRVSNLDMNTTSRNIQRPTIRLGDFLEPSGRLSESRSTYSRVLESSSDELFVQVGDLHLTLTREGEEDGETKSNCPATIHTVYLHIIDWSNDRLATTISKSGPASDDKGVIHPNEIRKGESITVVDRGGHRSKDPLLISGGDGKVVAIRYTATQLTASQ